jgi:hypothetical protein
MADFKKKQLNADLISIEQQLSDLFEKCPSQIFEQEDLELLKVISPKGRMISSLLKKLPGDSGVGLSGLRKETKILEFFTNLRLRDAVTTQFGTFQMRMGI